MHIEAIRIKNFKCFKGPFDLALNGGLNILVGDNEAGKSTILEALHLALTGVIGGRYLKNDLSQYLFNNDVVNEYLESLGNGKAVPPPHILIEVYLSGEDTPELRIPAHRDRAFQGNVNADSSGT